MKRIWIYLAGVALVAAAVAVAWIAFAGSKDHADNGQNQAAGSLTAPQMPKKACDIFTLADAKKLLGDSAQGGQDTSDASSIDIDSSTCSYTQSVGATPVVTRLSASLTVRDPKTSTGAASNQRQFGHLRPADAVDVQGYGDSAYWDPKPAQLDILKSDSWYILSLGPTDPAGRTLDDTKKLADILTDKI